MIRWAIIIGLICTAGQAWAGPADTKVKLCFKYEVDYRDRAVGDWTDTTMIARGVYFYVQNKTTGSKTFHWASKETGCTTLTLNARYRYSIRMQSKAKVTNDNIITLRVSPDNPINYGWTADADFSPMQKAGRVSTFTWPTHPGGDYSIRVSNIIAAASFSLHRRYGGLKNKTFVAYREPCNPSGGSCLKNDPNGGLAVFLSASGGTRNKFQISHEIGHLLAAKRNQNERTNTSGYGLTHQSNDKASQCADANDDYKHHFYSEEYVSSAANEGLAHFYAAAIWNSPNDNDCDWYSYYDGSTISCETGRKYLINTCYGGQEPKLDTGNELDWMRFWWDVHTDCDINFEPIMDIWDRSNPHKWKDRKVVRKIMRAARKRLNKKDYRCLKNEAIGNGVKW